MLRRTCPVCHHKPLTVTKDYLVCYHCHTFNKRLNFLQRPLAWATQRGWWLRLPILIYVIWVLLQLLPHMRDLYIGLQNRRDVLWLLDFGIHELGHILFKPFGEFMYIAGGSLFQCLFPLMGVVAFWQIRWYFASAMCWPWLGMNLFQVADYAADARARLLPLASLGGDYDKAHDWYQILSRLNRLDQDQIIAYHLRQAGVATMVIGIVLGSILVWYMGLYGFYRVLDRHRKA
ncbi:MAG: hypothetical protein JWS12_241 [Candidatus Saccharibacteria bacterium]|nr:hypothetical protein [Candidatus Saccharibacteria bacterium]